ncbi:60S ribosomal protein L18-B [Cucumispora dikerogammari]|nr:60S ribosomal protein L18-B [Cucumispora dikerogammari]
MSARQIKKKTPKYPIFNPTRTPRSENTFLLSLFNFYKKLSENTTNEIIQKITKRLTMSRTNRQPLTITSLLCLAKKETPVLEDKIIVFVGKLLEDETLLELPKLQIVCLSASKTIRKRIEFFGGEIHTLEKLIKLSGDMENVVLVTSDRTRRKATKYFGVPGDKRSGVYPRTINKGRNGERRICINKKISYEK